MMDKKLISLLVVATIGLSACGSTGGMRNGKAEGHALGGGSSNSSDSSGNNRTTQQAETASSNSQTPTDGIRTHGYIIYHSPTKLDVNGEEPEANYLAPISESEVNVLKVEGRHIQLIPDDKIGVKDWVTVDKKAVYDNAGVGNQVNKDTWAIVGNQLKHAKFGEMYVQGEKRFRFAQGVGTPDDKMPTSKGQVKYTGHSTYSPDFSTPLNKPILGRSEFTVDFGEKTVKGQIMPTADANNANKFEPVVLEGVIKGHNHFEGVNPLLGPSNKAVIEGAFYGPNAEEMAGVYYYSKGGKINRDSKEIDPEKPNGTFGATK